MMNYNVLWLDDEFEKFTSFNDLAKRKQINLVPFKIRQEGLNELLLHPNKYDAVLMDAKMPENQINETTGIDGIKRVLKAANELHIPVFISTGQPDLQSDNTFKHMHDYIFVKGDATDTFGGDTELFEAMLYELGKKEESIIKQQYIDVFTGIKKLGFENECIDKILPILKALHYPEKSKNFSPNNNYNSLRIIIEDIFKSLCNAGVLPDAFIKDGKVNILESYRYLTGSDKKRPQHIGYYHDGEIIPRSLAEQLSPVIFTLNAQSHPNAHGYTYSKYNLFSYTMLVCETILWTNKYIEEHNDYEINKSEWCEFTPKKK